MKTLLLGLLLALAPVQADTLDEQQCKATIMLVDTQPGTPINRHLPDLTLRLANCSTSITYHASGVEIKFLPLPGQSTEMRVFYPIQRILSVTVEPLSNWRAPVN